MVNNSAKTRTTPSSSESKSISNSRAVNLESKSKDVVGKSLRPPPRTSSKAKTKTDILIHSPIITSQTQVNTIKNVCDAKLYTDEQLCGTDVTKVTLELVGDANASPLSEADRWICRPEPKPPSRGPIKAKQNLLFETVNRKCEEAMALLLEKFEKGLIPLSEIQKCDPTMQNGIDVTPTPSRCLETPGPSKSYGISKSKSWRIKSYKTMSKVVPQQPVSTNVTKEPLSSNAVYCPIRNQEVGNYVKEPLAHVLLRQVGALDERGNLTCEMANFDEVEHGVKNLLIKRARDVEHQVWLAAQFEKSSHKSPLSQTESTLSPEKRFDQKTAYMRGILLDQIACHKVDMVAEPVLQDIPQSDKIDNVLEEKALEDGAQDFQIRTSNAINKKSVKINTPHLESSNHHETTSSIQEKPSRAQQSVPQNNIHEVIVRLTEGMNRRSTSLRGSSDIDLSVIEILPFEDWASFYDDEIENPLGANDPMPKKSRKSDRERIKVVLPEVIYAQFDGKNVHVEDCIARQEAKEPLNFAQWENRKLCTDLQKSGNLNKDARQLYLCLKYFSVWLDTTKQRRSWRLYCPCENLFSMWGGRYPLYVLDQIRDMDDSSNFVPRTEKEFYAKLRKIEKHTFDYVESILRGDNDSADGEKSKTEGVKQSNQSINPTVSIEEGEGKTDDNIPPEEPKDVAAQKGRDEYHFSVEGESDINEHEILDDIDKTILKDEDNDENNEDDPVEGGDSEQDDLDKSPDSDLNHKETPGFEDDFEEEIE